MSNTSVKYFLVSHFECHAQTCFGVICPMLAEDSRKTGTRKPLKDLRKSENLNNIGGLNFDYENHVKVVL